MNKTAYRFAALLLAAVLLLGVLPVSAALPMTELQRAVVETALAYHYRGKYVQYDSVNLTVQSRFGGDGSDLRKTDYTSPEDATEHDTFYSVCSAYCFDVYYDAFGYKLLGSAEDCITKNMCSIPADDPICVVKYDSTGEDTGSKVLTDQEAALKAAEDALQPGDVVVGYGSTGHAVIYIGDYKGDGNTYIAHCWGKKYNMETGTDAVESYKDGNGGAIRVEDAHKALFVSGGTWALTSSAHATRFVVLRPLNVLDASKLTESAKTRLKYSGLNVDRTTSLTRFQSVEPGNDVAVTITVENRSAQSYNGLPVTETVPEGAALKDGSVLGGGSVSGSAIQWTLDVPAGKSVTVGYTVTATGKRGDTLKFECGTVGGIRSNRIAIPISGKQLTAEQIKALQGIASKEDAFAGLKSDAAFANAVYKTMLGIDPKIPSLREIALSAYTYKEVEGADEDMFERNDKADGAAQMLVPLYHGGMVVKTGGNGHARVLDVSPMHLMAGDVLLRGYRVNSERNGKYEAYVALGNGRMASMKGGKLQLDDAKAVVQKNLMYDFFVLVRPSLAYDDMTTEAKADGAQDSAQKLPFTDVKQGDWYFDYVSELYADDIISGMNETTFAPGGTLTYGQALKLLVAAMGKDVGNAKTGHWASGYLDAAQEKGWINGRVDLDAPISRLAFCKVAAKAKDLTEQPVNNPFTDTNDEAVLALYNAEVINGMTETTFSPDATLTRAQISKIISLMRGL